MPDARVKVLELDVARDVVKGVRFRAEVARVDRHAAERIAMAAFLRRVKVEADDLFLIVLAEQLPIERRRLCEGAAEADNLLVAPGRVHCEALGRRPHRDHLQRRHVLQELDGAILEARGLHPFDLCADGPGV